MKKHSKLFAALLSAAAACCMMQTTAYAATIDDVCNALRDIGIPEAQVQSCMNYYYSCPHDENGVYDPTGAYQTYDTLVELVYIMQDSIRERLNAMFPSAPATTTTAPAAPAANETTAAAAPTGTDTSAATNTPTATTAAPLAETTMPATTQKPFINMTYEEKCAYISSLSEEERTDFINNLSVAERNSLIKQLPTDEKAAIAQDFVDLMKEFGLMLTVDDIDNLDISVHDAEGNLVDSSSIGISIDDTGWNLTAPLVISVSALLLSVGGLTWLAFHAQGTPRKKEAE